MIDTGMSRELATGLNPGGSIATPPRPRAATRGVGKRAARWSPAAARGAVLLVALAAAAAGFVATDPQAAAVAVAFDPELAWLLRAMAVLKMAAAAAATAGIVWRLGGAATSGWLVGYALALAAAWAGPGLIWNLAHLRLGALLLHGGLAGALVLLWRDPVVGARLGAIIAARRRVLRERSVAP
jgi:hypothetical protein